MKWYLLMFLAFVSINTNAQLNSAAPYKVTVIRNVLYDSSKNNYRHKLDVYIPENNVKHRPVIIWMHGGGFWSGNKTSRGIPLWCRQMAAKGYVCAAVNYTLTKKNPLDGKTVVLGCANAMEDIQQAIAFLKSNGDRWNIDTGKVVLAGNSAGAILALQTAYSNRSAVLQLFDNKTSAPVPALPIAAVLNFWGAIFDTSWLAQANVPILTVQGIRDNLVPFTTNNLLYGGKYIQERADSLGIRNRLIVFDGIGHELQQPFNPLFAGCTARKRWKIAGEYAAKFLNGIFYESTAGLPPSERDSGVLLQVSGKADLIPVAAILDN